MTLRRACGAEVLSGKPSGCDFFDRCGVLLQECGQRLPLAHLVGCPSCQQQRRQLAQLREALLRLPAPAGRSGWQTGVWARIDRGDRAPSAPRRSRWWELALGLPAVVAIAAAWLFWVRPPVPHVAVAQPLLAMRVVPGPHQNRTAGQAAAGDDLVVQVSRLASRLAELRIYREDGGLAVRCSEQPPCSRRGDRLLVQWRIPAVGRFRIQVLGAASALPPASGSYDRDTAAVMSVGEVWRIEELLEVW